jgi:hypothetical protein
VTVVSLLVSIVGGAVTATIYINDLQHRLTVLEQKSSDHEAAMKALKTDLSAPSQEVTHPSTVLNTNAGFDCGAGFAISQLNVSSVSFAGIYTCQSIRPVIH